MNDITVFIYFICFAAISGAAFAFMWRSMGYVIQQMETYVDRNPRSNAHPEAPKAGEEVMGVTFKNCDIEEYNDLQNRINELKKKLEDDDEEEDGGLVVRK